MEAEGPPDDEGRSSAAITAEDLKQIHDPVVRAKVEYFAQHSFEMIRSPLLPPEVLARYGNVVPGLPEKFVRWTEEESEHRRAMERAAFEEVRTLRARAQAAGFSVALVGLLAAGYVAVTANSFPGTLAAGVIAIVGVGGPFAARILASRWGRSDDATNSQD